VSDHAATTPARMPLDQARRLFPPMWIVYDHPRDYPFGYIARLWYGMTPTAHVWTAPSLVLLREFIVECGGSMPLARKPEDDPCIVETWV
jgi:hypothetical protein